MDVHKLEKDTKYENGKLLFIDWTAMDSYCNLKLEDHKMEYYYNFLDQFENKCIVLEDLHCWSYDEWENLSWHLHSTYKRIYNFLHTHNIYFCTTMYQCPEFAQLEGFYNFKKIYTIPHHFNSEEFQDYKIEKNYDILMYGNIDPKLYKFRNRLAGLLDTMKGCGIKIRGITYDENIRGDELAKLINQAYLCVATKSDYDYMVAKYFEIAACNTCILGNINEQGKEYFGDNMVLITAEMSDDQIKNLIFQSLFNKKSLINHANENYKTIDKYAIRNYPNHLLKIYDDVKEFNIKEESNYKKSKDILKTFDSLKTIYNADNVSKKSFDKIAMKSYNDKQLFVNEAIILHVLKDYDSVPKIIFIDFEKMDIYCEYFGEQNKEITTDLRLKMREIVFKIKEETRIYHNDEYLENLYIKDGEYFIANFEKADYTWIIYPKYLKDNDNYPPNHILNVENCLGENNKNPELSELLNRYY